MNGGLEMLRCSLRTPEIGDAPNVPVESKRGEHGVALACNSETGKPVESGATTLEDTLKAFMQVVEQRRAQLLWQAQHFTNSREEAEDIVQEAVFRAFKNLPHFRDEAKMGTWLHVIVKNIGREWLRKKKGRTNLPLEYARSKDDEHIVFDLPDPGQNPEQCCERREIEGILLSAIDELNSVCKRTIKMCVLEELPHFEAANVLGKNAFTMKSQNFHGKRMLKRAISLRTGERGFHGNGV